MSNRFTLCPDIVRDMSISIESCVCIRVAFVLVVLVFIGHFDSKVCFAENNNDRFALIIQPDPEVKALIEASNYLAAELLARERNLDPRIIAALSVKNGKQNEAFDIFADFIREAPENRKRELANQAVNFFLHNVSAEIGEEFSHFLQEGGVLILSDDQVTCAEVNFLIRAGRFEEAEHKVNLLLDSAYAEDSLINTVMLLVANLDLHRDFNPERNAVLYEKLLRKFPDNFRVKLQWIGSLTMADPSRALVELDLVRSGHPSDYASRESSIRLLRGNAFSQLGEYDRAKSEYSALIGTNYEAVARGRISANEFQGNLEQRIQQQLREQIAQSHQRFEVPEPAGRPWGIIIGVNAVIIAIIFFLWWRTRK